MIKVKRPWESDENWRDSPCVQSTTCGNHEQSLDECQEKKAKGNFVRSAFKQGTFICKNFLQMNV